MVIWAIAFAVGIWAAKYGPCGSTLIAGLTLACSFVLGDRKGLWLVVTLVLAGVVAMNGVQKGEPFAVGRFVGQTVTLVGTVDEMPRVKDAGEQQWNIRYLLRTEMAGVGTTGEKTSGLILVTVTQAKPIPGAGYGDSVIVSGSLRALHFYKNPGLPDIASMLAQGDIQGRMSVKQEAVRVRPGGREHSIAARLGRWREQLRLRMEAAMPPSDSAVLMGMVFGGYDGIERQTVRDYGSTGIVHILSVSGAHVALLAGAVLWMGRRFRVATVLNVWAAALVLGGYGVICGFSAPVVRSLLMGGVGLFAVGTGRMADAQRALTISFFGMLAYDPRNLFDIGFQLSFGCTAGLLYLFVPLREVLYVLPDFTRDAVAGTIAAEGAVLPLISWYFGWIPLVSVVAAILVVPLLEATIIVGIVAALVVGASSGVAHVLFVGASLMIGTANQVNAWLAHLPATCLPLPPWWSVILLPYYGTILWSAGLLRECLDPPGVTMKKQARPYLVALAIIMGMIGWQLGRPNEMEVHFIDVGQGDATLVVTPHRRAILIDAGGIAGPQGNFDPGERVVVPYLRHNGVTVLDWMILTHGHEDHAGGAAAVAQLIGTRNIADNASGTGALLRLDAATSGVRRLRVTGNEIIEIDGVRMDLYVANEDENNPATGKAGRSRSENERSVVARIVYGKQCFLVTGDLEGESEKILMEKQVGVCQVLKVGHHGARTSTTEPLLQQLNPVYAVISVGADNRFGHPNPDTVRRLQEWPVRLYRTDRDGAVVFRTNGNSLTVEKFVE